MYPPAPVLVLGLGNDILTDDAVGLHIVDIVQARLATEHASIEVKSTTEMGLALLDEIADRESLVLVDSVQTGKVHPGYIHEIGPENLAQVFATSPHFLGVGETLSLGKLLGIAMPARIRIFAIEVSDPFTLGTSLTPAVAQVVEKAADRIARQARDYASLSTVSIAS